MENQKHLFQLAENHSYLNTAYMSPMLTQVAEAGNQGMARKFQPNLIRPEDFFSEVEILRKSFAQLIGADEYLRVSVIPSVSYGIAGAANNIEIKSGQKILLAEEQFPSNYYSWQRLAQQKGARIQMVSPPAGKNRGQRWNQEILDQIDENTAVVAIGNIHWADGTLFDLKAIREKTRKFNAYLVIDASQSLGTLPFDVGEVQPDALICVAYKWLLGPYSLGMAYYGERFDGGVPIEENWMYRKGGEDFQNLVNYQSDYQPFASRYSVGEASNFISVPMMIEGLKQIKEWGVENIQEYAQKLSTPFVAPLREMGCQIEEEEYRCHHLIGIRLSESGIDPAKLKQSFAQKNITVSMRGNAIRVSTHVFNTVEDWERLVSCFRECRR